MTQQNDNLIEVRDLKFSRGNRIIYDGIDMDIRRGKITAFMGPSGTGKTTLLRIIGGELTPDSGDVSIDGLSVPNMTRKQLFDIRRDMGMMFQSSALFSQLTVFENVAFPIREHTNLSENMIRDLVLMKLDAVGLRGARDLMPTELSGGMARRVAMARAVALDPALIMYDEPFVGQDPISMGVLVTLIKRLNDALQLTSVIVSHDVPEVASIADYIYLVANGKVIGQGTPEELKYNDAPRVKQFMTGLPDGPVPFHFPAEDFAKDLLAGSKA
ncbi:ATP-binding cassette domain-containing protein [Pelagibaculum spongiae]|uniref:Phospholipid ABC transporter ATP-binding protein MlaF n=1 Tax=Pelagibaculum spongiae TaxID=2080658 RepID=A0A2V1H401_9GAMM|nr:ATP-binding cassette domain-containing protein [Pelagibaculum spongiae]PVZ71917.1 phospholipid ABC transporter ATP-binding protein MlaF [Pelagibaculum spongiae]